MTVAEFEKHVRTLLHQYAYHDHRIELPDVTLHRTGTDHYQRAYELATAQFKQPGISIRYDRITTHAIGTEPSGFLSITAAGKTFSVGIQDEYTIMITDLFSADPALEQLHGKSLWDCEEKFYTALDEHIRKHAEILNLTEHPHT